MSSFTMLTRDAIKRLGATSTFATDGRIDVVGNIGLTNYPIFDEGHRRELNSKILRRYWMQEIGMETAELWKFEMETLMIETMPYYNELYKSQLIEFNPLHTVDIKNTGQSESNHNATTESDSDSDATNGSKSRAVNSNFPQAPLRRNADYASNGADSMSETSSVQHTDATSTATGSDTGETESSTVGYQGIPADLIVAFRQSIINIDSTVVDSLDELFMGIFHNGSAFGDASTYERYGI
jgi:hypothetical protein